jgi:O-antigen/teichoic acid export membrane protein
MVVSPAASGPPSGGIRRGVARNAAANYAGKFVVAGVTLALTRIMLHHLGPVNYALWAITGSLITYGTLLDLGIDGAITKYTAEFRARQELHEATGILSTALAFYCLLGLFAAVLGAALSPLLPHLFHVPPEARATASRLMLVTGIAVGVMIPTAIPMAAFRGLQRYDVCNALEAGASILSAAAIWIVLFSGGGVVAAVAGTIPISLLTQAVGVQWLRRVAPELHIDLRRASRAHARQIFRFSSAIFLTRVAGQLDTQTDELIIGSFLPIVAITPYSLGRKLSRAVRIIASQFTRVLFPLASDLRARNDRERLTSLYLASTRLALAISFPVGVFVITLARPILTVWVGPAYAGATTQVTILTAAALLMVGQTPAMLILQGMGRHRTLGIVSLACGIGNALLSILLIRYMGTTGVALSTLISAVANGFGFVMPYSHRAIGVPFSRTFREVLLPVLVPAIPLIGVEWAASSWLRPDSIPRLLLLAFLSVLVYGAAYLPFGAVQMERSWLLASLRRPTATRQ